MGKHERRAYREAIRGRYRKLDRAAKAAILDEFCAVCGFSRKYAIRLLSQLPRKDHSLAGWQRHPSPSAACSRFFMIRTH